MSTTALHILEQVKSLPAEDQRLIREDLNRQPADAGRTERRPLKRTPDGGYYNPDGIPNEDPVFKILEEIEAERHRQPGPPAPQLD